MNSKGYLRRIYQEERDYQKGKGLRVIQRERMGEWWMLCLLGCVGFGMGNGYRAREGKL